jgi:hypothetical protein
MSSQTLGGLMMVSWVGSLLEPTSTEAVLEGRKPHAGMGLIG